MDAERTGLGIEQVVQVVRRRAIWIVACVVVVAGSAYGVSELQTKKYTAAASLVFNNNQPSQQIAGLSVVSGSSSQQALQNTNVKLAQLGDMAEKTAAVLGHGLTKKAVNEALEVSAQGESNIVKVAATSTAPAFAAAIANNYTTLFVSEQQNANHQYYSSALAVVRKQLAAMSPQQQAGTAGLALQDRAQALAVLAELQSGTVQVAQAATVPTSPSSPKTLRNTALAGVLGLLLGLGVAFLMQRLDQRIREPKDLQEIYGLPLLGVVPESSALALPKRRSAGQAARSRPTLPPNLAEAFQLVRAHLRYFNVDREVRTLVIASAAPGDGKTTIALNLATAAARMGSTVLLLEADLRHPTLARQLDFEPGPGLSDVLVGSVSLWKATRSADLEGEGGASGPGMALDVLTGGALPPPNPGELIESEAMAATLKAARSTYDLVVIDTPPLIAVSDAFPLLRMVDGVIVVAWVGRSRRDVAQRLRQTLSDTSAPLLGVVANGFNTRRRSSGYGYGYGYDYAPSAVASQNGALASRASVRTTREQSG